MLVIEKEGFKYQTNASMMLLGTIIDALDKVYNGRK